MKVLINALKMCSLEKHTKHLQGEKTFFLPLLRLRPLCHGPAAQPPAAKATNLYKYSWMVRMWVGHKGRRGGIDARHKTGEIQIFCIKRGSLFCRKKINTNLLSVKNIWWNQRKQSRLTAPRVCRVSRFSGIWEFFCVNVAPRYAFMVLLPVNGCRL